MKNPTTEQPTKPVTAPPGSITLTDGILALVRTMVAQSNPVLRERLARTFDALPHSIPTLQSEQVAVFLMQLVSDIKYAACDPEQKTPRPIATFMDPRLLTEPKGSA